jgi:hypothetical protein
MVCPSQFLFTGLSLVIITCDGKNHISTFIFGGTFIFQIYFLRYFVLSFRTFKYMDLTVYPPKAGRLQTKTSLSLLR